MQQTYLFYDIETTGLNKCFDQVLQFAAIRTDLELNELERHEILVKLNPDIIPTPKALITHNISIAEAEAGVCEYEAISQIHQLMNQPGTISVGYNTLGFDDEFLRFSFYRNLLPSYTHQYANNCSRMDIYPMAVMYYVYKNAAIKWPDSLKLEELNNANQFVDGNSHDAMIDVRVTIELARKFIQYRRMWEYLRRYFAKNTDLQRIMNFSQAIMVDGSFGVDNNYHVPVLNLGSHNHYKNQTLWLRLDLPELTKTTLEAIAATTYVINKKVGDKYFLLPPQSRFEKHISAERLAIVNENKKWLDNNPQIHQEIVEYYKEFVYPRVPNADIDTTLYQDGFLSNAQQAQCAQFHTATMEQKVAMLDQLPYKLREQAIRILGRNYPDYLSEKHAAEFSDYLKQVNPAREEDTLVDFKNNKRLTPKVAMNEIVTLKKAEPLTNEQLKVLDGLESYLNANNPSSRLYSGRKFSIFCATVGSPHE